MMLPVMLSAPSPRTLLMIWEVLARTRTSPQRAVSLLARQGVTVTATEAAWQLAAAPDRNTLRLVSHGKQRHLRNKGISENNDD